MAALEKKVVLGLAVHTANWIVVSTGRSNVTSLGGVSAEDEGVPG